MSNVTDAMVDSAIEAHIELFDSGDAVSAMRAALTAALADAAAPARGFIKEHLERSLSEYDKTIARATDDGALSETGREIIIQSCCVSKSAIRAFAERLQTYAALTAPQAQEWKCICQDQHRRGYCKEPGCPCSVSRPDRGDK